MPGRTSAMAELELRPPLPSCLYSPPQPRPHTPPLPRPLSPLCLSRAPWCLRLRAPLLIAGVSQPLSPSRHRQHTAPAVGPPVTVARQPRATSGRAEESRGRARARRSRSTRPSPPTSLLRPATASPACSLLLIPTRGLRLKFDKMEGSNCEVCDSNE